MAAATPIILDTDIGTDIDDTWALAMLLKSPALDLRLVVSAHGDTPYRARVAAKLLACAGRSDVTVGIGIEGAPLSVRPQEAFVKDYELKAYPGVIAEDGVKAIIDAVGACEDPVTIVSIGPLTNVAAALDREPALAKRARIVGMHGSVRRGYQGSSEIAPEYNVFCDVEACRKVLAADWPVTLTPLDTCGLVRLKGPAYRRVRACADPIVSALFSNYAAWIDAVGASPERLEEKSTTLYDTVAIYLAESEDLLQMEEMGIRVDDEGFTRIDPEARKIRVATAWKSLDAFCELLVERLCA